MIRVETILRYLPCLLLFSFLFSMHANASTTYYNNESSFLNAAGSVLLESFEAEPETNTQSSYSINTGLLTVSPGANTIIGVWNTNADGTHATHGSNYIRMNTVSGPGTTALTFDFNTQISSFALEITDFGDFNGGFSLLFSNDAGDSHTIASGVKTNGNELFFGLSKTNGFFQSVTLFNENGIDGTGYDKVYFKPVPPTPVPLPASVMLFITGIMGLISKRNVRDFASSRL